MAYSLWGVPGTRCRERPLLVSIDMTQLATRDSRSMGVIVGLTGSIGAGKSVVAEVFQELGIPVLNADAIARDLMETDPHLRACIVELVGSKAYSGQRVNRQFLSMAIFSDPGLRGRVNDLVHPVTIAALRERATALFAEGHPLVVCEAALIYESGGEEWFDYVVVVDAERERRLERAAVRDRCTIDEIARREEAQIPGEIKALRADFVLRNDKGLDELRSSAAFIAALLNALPPRKDLEDSDSLEDGVSDAE